MSLSIVQTLRSKPVHEAARLIGSAPHFITDANLLNLLNQYELNGNPKDAKSRQKDAVLTQQLNLFAGIPGLQQQVSQWLHS